MGLRVSKLGNSAVSYEIGMFESLKGPFGVTRLLSNDVEDPSNTLAALGTFVHVYVDSEQRPERIPDDVRAVLETLQ